MSHWHRCRQNEKSQTPTELSHLLAADDLIHGIERPVLGDFKLLDEQSLSDVVDADHLRVAAGEDARPVGGVAQRSKEPSALLDDKNDLH